MKEIVHLVFTRFNLALHFGCEKRPDSKCPDIPWLDEKYLENRFKIFEKWTYPSLLNQTDQNFKWIVLFHKETPSEFKRKIKIYAENMDNFEAWYLDDEECKDFENIICQYIKINYLSRKIITTRIDNDDLVHERFIEFVKKDFSYKKPQEILSYQNGLQYDSMNKTLLKDNYVNNHFLSLYVLNADNEINHILQFNHAMIDKEVLKNDMSKIVINRIPPLWVEIITESNYSNRTKWRFKKILLPKSYREEYKLLGLWEKGYIYSMVMGMLKVCLNRGKGMLLKLKKCFHS